MDEHELLDVAVCKLFRKQRIYKMSFLGGLKEMSKSFKNNKVYLIVLVATMAAMAIALEKIGSLKVTPSIKITFYAVPLMVVGMLHGPKLGALAGLVSGIVIQLTSEYGINLSSIFFGLAPVVWGFVSGLIFKLVGKLSMFQEGDDFRSNGYPRWNSVAKWKDNKRHKSYTTKVLLYFSAVFCASVAANLSNTFAMFMDSLFIKDSYYTGIMILMDWPARLLTMCVSMIPYTIIVFVVAFW